MTEPPQPIRLDDQMLIQPDDAAPDYSNLVRLLNALYANETRSIFRYLDTWQPYTSAKTIKLRSEVRAMTRASYEHADRLAQLIADHRGVTTPGSFDDVFAAFNDVDWANMLPKLIASKQATIERYRQAIAAAPNLPGGRDIVVELERINRENCEHLEALESWRGRLSPAMSNGHTDIKAY